MSLSTIATRSRITLILIVMALLSALLLQRYVQITPPAEAISTSIVISQVYGGGGNSGSTYTNDFIELYNRGNTTITVTGWSVQYQSATLTTGTWQTTTLSGSIDPGHYYLVQEAAGTGGTTALPSPDVTNGVIPMNGTAAKVALVNNSTALPGGCPVSASIVDLVGYGGTANCSETATAPGLSNTTADIRKSAGCTETDNNSTDFFASGPIPRNSSAPPNTCSGDGTQPTGYGQSNPTGVEPSNTTLLTVTITPATNPPSTGITVTGNLSSIGGSSTQQFYDDATHGDVTAGDNVFSFMAFIGNLSTGAKNIPVTIMDAQARTAQAGITVSVQSPTCGVERWPVKTGTDPTANQVTVNIATPVTISEMRTWPAPSPVPTPPDNSRIAPYEYKVWVVNGTLTAYKRETDVDYHLVMQDGAGNTIVTEIPCPCCVGAGSPFLSGITTSRQTFDANLTATTSFQNPNVPVRVTGVGMFDLVHGQTGVAPNGIEIHPILSIKFPTQQSAPTGVGSGIGVQAGEAQITFSSVSESGTTTSTPIDPSAAGTPPDSSYKLVGPAFDISTNASTSGPINVCINVSEITDPAAFSNLKLLHSEGGNLVDRTTGQNFANKIICGSVTSLSPFVVALGAAPTAAAGQITGKITTSDGAPVDGVTITLGGSKNAHAITDRNGMYSFVGVETGGFYTVTASRANYTFSPASRSVSLLSNKAEASFTGTAMQATANPLDTTEYFVRQQYLDFLGREPEQGGLDYWSEQLRACNNDAGCLTQRRSEVSAAFFMEQEFQDTGFFVYRVHRAAFGVRPSYEEFKQDSSRIVNGLYKEVNKKTFVDGFVQRADFREKYPLMLSNEQFVNSLFDSAGLIFSLPERTQEIAAMNGGATRSDVLRDLINLEQFKAMEYNRAFVLMQYFGYLRREPDDAGYQFWVNVLNNQVGSYKGMVCAFITSTEYQKRFSPVVTHGNGDCQPEVGATKAPTSFLSRPAPLEETEEE